jgi:hypothetical protein
MPEILIDHLNCGFIILTGGHRGSIRKEPKMDARLKMSGMTDFFHHPCMSVAGIPLPIGPTRSWWRVSIFFRHTRGLWRASICTTPRWMPD